MGCDVFLSYTNLKDLYGAVGKFAITWRMNCDRRLGMFLLRYS